ncbi:hypothetical protein ERJ75_000010300 [Trypanosoma vivax]|nr:hypothetical protein ERJ75_000010300 [Trypanosoma vivax]
MTRMAPLRARRRICSAHLGVAAASDPGPSPGALHFTRACRLRTARVHSPSMSASQRCAHPPKAAQAPPAKRHACRSRASVAGAEAQSSCVRPSLFATSATTSRAAPSPPLAARAALRKAPVRARRRLPRTADLAGWSCVDGRPQLTATRELQPRACLNPAALFFETSIALTGKRQAAPTRRRTACRYRCASVPLGAPRAVCGYNGPRLRAKGRACGGRAHQTVPGGVRRTVLSRRRKSGAASRACRAAVPRDKAGTAQRSGAAAPQDKPTRVRQMSRRTPAGQRRAAAATGGSNAVTAGRRIAFEERSDPGSHADRSETAHLEHGEGEAVGNPLPAVVTHRRRRWEVGPGWRTATRIGPRRSAWLGRLRARLGTPRCAVAWQGAERARETFSVAKEGERGAVLLFLKLAARREGGMSSKLFAPCRLALFALALVAVFRACDATDSSVKTAKVTEACGLSGALKKAANAAMLDAQDITERLGAMKAAVAYAKLWAAAWQQCRRGKTHRRTSAR